MTRRISIIRKFLLCLAGSTFFAAYTSGHSIGTGHAADGTGPGLFIVVVDPGIVTIAIEAPLANYGVAPNSDYDTMRNAVSAVINSDIEDIELSTASKIVPNEEAVCRHEVGNERINEQNGQWVVVLEVDFACEQASKLTHLHFNIFDVPGFTAATARIIDGDREVEVPLDGANRKLDLQ